MGSVLQYDDAATRRLLALYESPDVAAQREAFVRILAPRRGESVVDVGSGPGSLAALIADAVEVEGCVRGFDISEPLLAAARRHCVGRPQLRFTLGDATRLPAPHAKFDAAVSVQALEYVADVDAALAELRRVLRPAGRVVIVDIDWDSLVWATPDAALHRRVLEAWGGHAPHRHLPRSLARRLGQAGFALQGVQVLPLLDVAHREDSYSHRVIALIEDFVARGEAAGEAHAWAAAMARQAASGEWFFSLNRYVFSAARR